MRFLRRSFLVIVCKHVSITKLKVHYNVLQLHQRRTEPRGYNAHKNLVKIERVVSVMLRDKHTEKTLTKDRQTHRNTLPPTTGWNKKTIPSRF